MEKRWIFRTLHNS